MQEKEKVTMSNTRRSDGERCWPVEAQDRHRRAQVEGPETGRKPWSLTGLLRAIPNA